MADQRKLNQNIGLENINMTSNYDVTNNAHQIQMTPYATEWKPPWKFSAYAIHAGGGLKMILFCHH